jgi:hypothetical protein
MSDKVAEAIRAREEAKGAPSLDKLKKDELVAMAEAQGLDTSGTKDDIVKRLEDGK